MNASTEESSSCTDCQGLTSASMQPTRAHPYLVFSGSSRETGARQFLCLLCRSTFSFETPHAAIDSAVEEITIVRAGSGKAASEAGEALSGDLQYQHTRTDNKGTGGQA